MFTHAPRIRPLRLALATALIVGTLSGSALAADDMSSADLTCRKAGGSETYVRKAGGTQENLAAADMPGGEQSIIAVL